MGIAFGYVALDRDPDTVDDTDDTKDGGDLDTTSPAELTRA
jgi:hypothetical protein